jgi:hypothetical protein
MSRIPGTGDVVFHALSTPGLDIDHRVAARISGNGAAVQHAEQGLPVGAARAEAVAVRLKRSSGELNWDDPGGSSFRGLWSTGSSVSSCGGVLEGAQVAEPNLNERERLPR